MNVPSDPSMLIAGKKDATYTVLVSDLERKIVPGATTEQRIRQMIESAKEGVYSDFQSPYAIPKLLLMSHLSELGFEDLVGHVIAGNYD